MAFKARMPPTPSSNSWRMRTRPSPPYKREVNSRSSGALPGTLESSSSRSHRPTFNRHTLARKEPLRVSISTVTGSPDLADGHFHGQLADVGLKILFPLPAVPIQPLAEISLAVEKPHAHQRNIEVRGALDVIAGKDSQAAGIDGDRFVQAEFGGEVSHRPRPQHAGMLGAPGPVPLQIFALPAVGVIDSPMQHQFPRAALNPRQGRGASTEMGL